VTRVLRRARRLVSDLDHVDARRLDTFPDGTLSQKAFEDLQEDHRFSYYTSLFYQEAYKEAYKGEYK
jgi:hypothetical protein